MQYIKLPIVVEAFRLKNDYMPDWFMEAISTNDVILNENGAIIKTLEGVMQCYNGDMIILGIEGEIYPCRKDIFDNSYKICEKKPRYPVIGSEKVED